MEFNYHQSNALTGNWGDGLWVQEEHYLDLLEDKEYSYYLQDLPLQSYLCYYTADGSKEVVQLTRKDVEKLRKRKAPISNKTSGRFMYRSCSRFLHTIKDIRIQQVNSISTEDAIAEGVELLSFPHQDLAYRDYLNSDVVKTNPIASFRSLWESIHGEGSWERNEWVWVIDFS